MHWGVVELSFLCRSRKSLSMEIFVNLNENSLWAKTKVDWSLIYTFIDTNNQIAATRILIVKIIWLKPRRNHGGCILAWWQDVTEETTSTTRKPWNRDWKKSKKSLRSKQLINTCCFWLNSQTPITSNLTLKNCLAWNAFLNRNEEVFQRIFRCSSKKRIRVSTSSTNLEVQRAVLGENSVGAVLCIIPWLYPPLSCRQSGRPTYFWNYVPDRENIILNQT